MNQGRSRHNNHKTCLNRKVSNNINTRVTSRERGLYHEHKIYLKREVFTINTKATSRERTSTTQRSSSRERTSTTQELPQERGLHQQEHKNNSKRDVSNINKNKWEDPHKGTRPRTNPKRRRERNTPKMRAS